MNFKQNPHKAIFWTGFALVLIFTLIGFVANWAAANPDKVLAIVNGEKITKSMADQTNEKFKKFFEKDGGRSDVQKQEEAARILIEEKVVVAEAQKQNIAVTAEEIEEKFNTDAQTYGGKVAYLEFVKNLYGWDEAQVKLRIKIQLLRDKLEPVVLNNFSVDGYYARWDLYGKDEAAAARAKVKLEEIKKEVAAGATIASINEKYKNDTKWRTPFTGELSFTNLNETTQKRFEGRQDWAAIKALTQKGTMTEIIKSDGGYFAFYRLISKNTGRFDTWEQFINSYYVKESTAFNVVKKLLGTKVAYALCENDALKPSATGSCCLLKDASASYHRAAVSGVVKDNITKTPISGVTVKLNMTVNGSALCSSEITTLGGTYYDTTSSTTGTYKLSGVNCWLTYTLSATKNGYENWKLEGFKPVNGQDTSQNIYLFPIYDLTVEIDPIGAATATEAVINSRSGVGGCEGAGKGCYATIRAGFENVSPNYQFIGWAGDACVGSTSPTCDVYMKGSKRIVARFGLKPPTTVPSCSVELVPPSGVAPLAVKAVVTPVNMPAGTTFNYDFGNGEAPLTNRGTVVYYTYAAASPEVGYNVRVTTSDGVTVCTGDTNIKVKSPTSGGGNEVTP